MSRRLTGEAFLDALDDICVEAILSMSGDELRAEILAEGGDPDAMVAECRAGLERAIRETEADRAAKKAPAESVRGELDMIGPDILVRVPELGAPEFNWRYVENREGVVGPDLPAVGSFW